MSDTTQGIQDTLDAMTIWASTTEFADCILWTGAVSQAGHPIYKPTGRGCVLVRRDVFRLLGNELQYRVPIDTKCGEKCCINPKHLFESTIREVSKRAAANGAFSGLVRCAKIAASRRGKFKLTIDQAKEIRMSDKTGPVLAKEFGVNKSVINKIKRGQSWKDYSNPYAGLMT